MTIPIEHLRSSVRVTCDRCHEVFSYEEDLYLGKDGVWHGNAEQMPDGAFVNTGSTWVCDECMRDENGDMRPEFR